MSSRTIIPSKKYATGSSKIAYETILNPGTISSGKFILPDGKYEEDVLIIQYLDDEEGKDIFEEMFLYDKFGKLGLSPKIYSIRIQIGNSDPEIINIDDYLQKYKSNSPRAKYSYLVDKIDCDKDLIKKYTKNGIFMHKKFFRALRGIVETLVQNRYINTDIKTPNLCIDNGVMKMIDFEDKFMKKIDDLQIDADGKIEDKHFINYMIFQVYLILKKYLIRFDQSLSLEDITDIDELDVDNMLKQLLKISRKTEYHPLQMLDHYLNRDDVFNYIDRDNLNRLREAKTRKERLKKLKDETEERHRNKSEKAITIDTDIKHLSTEEKTESLFQEEEKHTEPIIEPIMKISDNKLSKDQNGGKKRKTYKRNKKSKQQKKQSFRK
jgi:hypothetical protein